MSQMLFNEREQAFEAKFAHEAETEFLVRTRGGAMFVKWIAGLLNLDEAAASEQTNRMLAALMTGQSDKTILSVVADELAQFGQSLSSRELAAQLVQCRAEARQAIFAS